MSGAANQIVHNVGGKTDKTMHIHSHSPQLLNEMIEYADEHDIKRSRDMIVRKVITENGEVKSHVLSDSMIIVFWIGCMEKWSHCWIRPKQRCLQHTQNPSCWFSTISTHQTRILCWPRNQIRIVSTLSRDPRTERSVRIEMTKNWNR